MTEMNKPDSGQPPRDPDVGFAWFLVLLVLLVPLAIVAVTLLTHFEEGELILTARGCRVMAYHGVSLETLDAEGLCRVRARFHFVPDTTRFGTIRIDTAKGQLDIDLHDSEVVSKAT